MKRFPALSRLLIPLAFCVSAAAQTGPTLAGIGYEDPQWLIVAPGQVVTLFITGATIILPQQGANDTVITAGQLPLPTSLAGFSVGLSQSLPPYTSGPARLPIFTVEQANHCTAKPDPGCVVTAITVEIPPGLKFPLGLTPFGYSTTLTIFQNGVASNEYNVSLLPVNPHILTLCDSSLLNRPGIEASTSQCASLVTHADGSLVTPSSAARVGETLVLYAYGLGPTVPSIDAGVPTPMSLVPTQAPYTLLFAYRGAVANPAASPAVFAGLTPGQVGLYQLNFAVPPPTGDLSDCSSPDGANLIVMVFNAAGFALANGSVKGFDSVRICVIPAAVSRSAK